MEEFKDRYVKLLKYNNLTIYKLAKKSGINDASLGQYAKGRIPNGNHLSKIAVALNTTIDYLINGEEVKEGKTYSYVHNLNVVNEDPVMYMPQTKNDSNKVSEPIVEYGLKPSNQLTDYTMNELEFYKKQNELLTENHLLLKEKILNLEKEIKACKESNRVKTH